MGTCLSKKKGSSTSSPVPEVKNFENGVTVSKTKLEENEAQVKLKKEKNKKKILEDKNELLVQKGPPVRKEIFIIKHRKSHDFETKVEAIETTKGGFGVRTSSCTKEEVDAILIHCGKLSRNNSFGKKPMRSGSKKSFDFDQCDSSNGTVYNDEEQKKINESSGLCKGEDKQHQHQDQQWQLNGESSRPSSRGSSSRRRTPSREREQSRSSSRERRVSRSPGKRLSETTTTANGSSNSNAGSSSKPGKMVSVPATVSSLSNGGGGGECATTTSIRRITVRRNVGAPSPRSQSPARVNGNAANASRVLSDDQQQQHPSLSRNSSRKAEHFLQRRNPMNEIDPNTLAYPHSTANTNDCSRVQNRPKKEIETQANQKPNVDVNDNVKNWTSSRVELDKGVGATCKAKVQQEEDAKVESSMTDNIVLMTVVPPEVDNLKPQTLTRSRSSRQSWDLDHMPEVLSNPQQSYTSLLLQDIQNFHKKNSTPSVSLPACVAKACSILEAVAELNSSTTSSKNPLTYHQSSRNDNNVLLSTNHYGKRVLGTKDPFVESEVVLSDDVMEPSLQKYVTFERGGSHSGVDTMEEQESSGSNSLTINSGQQQHWSISSSSREPYSDDSKGCWTSRMNYSRELGSEKSTRLGRKGVMMKP